jgi:aminoglycoside N3'-acetyltransferase
MRKKTKRKVWPLITNTMEFVKLGLTPVAENPHSVKLELMNYESFDEVINGNPTQEHVARIIDMLNLSKLIALNFGHEFDKFETLCLAERGAYKMASKGVSGKSFRFTGEDLSYFREAMLIHSEQLKKCTVFELDKCVKKLTEIHRHGRGTVIRPMTDEELNALEAS